MQHRRLSGFEIALAGSELPTEFLIFRAGLNSNTKGFSTLYDEKARDSVLGDFQSHGVDIMIDLEHLSVDETARRHREDADDARGWCKLEDRNGELWAVDVRWTPDGERRLRQKTQRYTSPTFATDLTMNDRDADLDGTNVERPRFILNIALCAMPATDQLPGLVAASQRAATIGKSSPAPRRARNLSLRKHRMDPEKLKAAIEAIKAQDAGAALTLLEEMVVSAAAGSAEAGPEEMSADAAGQGEGEQALAEVADPAPDEDKQLMATLRAAVGATDNASLVRQLSTVFSEVRTLRERREDLDMTERRALVSQLVQVEAETPATAWEDADKQLPCKRLRDESLESLRDRAQKLTAAKGGARALRAPARSNTDEHVRAAVSRLSPRELSQIKARGMTPEQFIAHRDSLVRPIGKDAQ